MRAVLVAGSRSAGEPDEALLSTADLLVAVDGGADTLSRVGITPHLFVGDADSVSPHVRAGLESLGVEARLIPVAKEETDTEVALRLVVERGADDIVVLGGLGGPRLDHMLGNLLLLTSPWLEGRRVVLADDRHEMFLARGEAVVEGVVGDTVSLLPLTSEVESVTTEGLLYPLRGETLLRATTRGISNSMTCGTARVTHGDGLLLVVRYLGR